MSIITTFLVINKKIKSWIFWILIAIIATYLYFVKGIRFVATEYRSSVSLRHSDGNSGRVSTGQTQTRTKKIPRNVRGMH